MCVLKYCATIPKYFSPILSANCLLNDDIRASHDKSIYLLYHSCLEASIYETHFPLIHIYMYNNMYKPACFVVDASRRTRISHRKDYCRFIIYSIYRMGATQWSASFMKTSHFAQLPKPGLSADTNPGWRLYIYIYTLLHHTSALYCTISVEAEAAATNKQTKKPEEATPTHNCSRTARPPAHIA